MAQIAQLAAAARGGQFAADWERCAHHLEGSLDHAGNTHSLGDVRRMVEAGDATFWPGEGCAAVTEIMEFPQFRSLHLWLVGGSLEGLRGLMPVADHYGRAMGCKIITTAGRDGWQRVLRSHGYEPAWHVCKKELAA